MRNWFRNLECQIKKLIRYDISEVVLFFVIQTICIANAFCTYEFPVFNLGSFALCLVSGFVFGIGVMSLVFIFGKASKFVLIPLVGISCVILPVVVFVRVNFNMQVTADIVLILLAATGDEMHMFMDKYVNAFSIVILLQYIALALSLNIVVCRAKIRKMTRERVVGGLLMFGLFYTLMPPFSQTEGKLNHLQAVNFCSNLLQSNEIYTDLAKTCKHPQLDGPIEVANNGKNPLYVIVLGESATRKHWSLYGYERPTNPRMEQVKDNLVIFKDLVTAWPSTQNSIYYTFTGANLEDEKIEARYTLFQLLNRAGYDVELYSGQAKKGIYDTIISYVFAQTTHSLYLEDLVEKGKRGYDEMLLPYIRESIKAPRDRPKLILVHLNGSHVDPLERYPENRAVFLPDRESDNSFFREIDEKLINAYDNSLVYTDMILGEIVKSLDELDEPTWMMYFSDHGESVHDKKWRVATDPMIWEVPFVIWYSNEYAAENQFMLSLLNEARDRQLQSDQLIGGITTLLGIVAYEWKSSANDFLGEQFEERKRRICKLINGFYGTDTNDAPGR